MVRYWASLGFTSAKAYMNITSAELAAAIDEAHRHGMKLTGHICSVGYEEAVRLGIDNLEHGPFAAPDGDLDTARATGMCSRAAPASGSVLREIVQNVEPLLRLLVLFVLVLVRVLFPVLVPVDIGGIDDIDLHAAEATHDGLHLVRIV